MNANTDSQPVSGDAALSAAPVAGDAVGFDAWWMRTNGTPVTGSVAENAARAAWQAALAGQQQGGES